MRRGERLGSLRLHERLTPEGTASVRFGWLVRAERLVAVKRIHPQHLADEVGVAQVREEVRRAMRVVHPNVVATLGIVRHRGELFAVMEYVPCASLAEVAGAAPGLEPHVASAIAAGALRGLHASHEARGGGSLRNVSCVSSGRVLVGEDGRSRVIDFDVPGPTTGDAIIDQLPYAAPEQLLRRGIDARRDVYAASVVLWETLTGRPLFRAATVEGTLRKILSEPVTAPSRFAPEVGLRLDAIVLRGLARDPSDRFASAGAMASALEQTSCASPDDVARALAAMDLAAIRQRRAAAEAFEQHEDTNCTSSAARRL